MESPLSILPEAFIVLFARSLELLVIRNDFSIIMFDKKTGPVHSQLDF